MIYTNNIKEDCDIHAVIRNLLYICDINLDTPLVITFDNLDVINTSNGGTLRFDYAKVFPWHLKDSIRSFTTTELNNDTYEFSYRRRLEGHFEIPKTGIYINQIGNNPYSTWDPAVDLNSNGRKPCFMNMFMNTKKGVTDFTIIFRRRDLCKRIIPNWFGIDFLEKEYCKINNTKQGKTVDISIDYFIEEGDFKKLIEVLK